MRILFVSSSPIRKEISIGNTFLNLFENFDDVELASIYTRQGKPDKTLTGAFCITEKMLIKNLLGKGPAGKKIDMVDNDSEFSDISIKQNKQIAFVKSHRWTIFFWIQNFVWKIGRWKSKEVKDFIEEYNPDLIFTVLSDCSFLNRLILYIKHTARVPLVVYAWDNNYSLRRLEFSPFKWINHFVNRRMMKKVVKASDLMYVISDIQKKDYEKAFNTPCKVLTKSYCFSEVVRIEKECNAPLKIVFTGNIGTNRWKALALIAKALKQINDNVIKAQLYIYTATPITKRMAKKLNIEGSSFLMGAVSADKVKDIQEEADILVHVESTDLKNRLLVRQSFSTKLVDYFHQAKCIFAFGHRGVASIDHLIKNDAAVTASSEKEIEEKLIMLIENPELIAKYGQKAWECGKNYHNRETIKKMLEDDFFKILSEK